MSYILDALKKADAERERRGVPSLSAQSATHADDERRGARGAGVAIVALLAALALGAWWWSGRDRAADPVPAVAAAPAAMPVPVPVPAPAPSITVPAPAAPPRAITVPPPPVIVPPAPVAAAPAPAPVPAVIAAAPSAPVDGRTPALSELSPDLRRQMPPLNVSGAVYSAQAAGRMVFINGQVLREGDAVAEGLVVERIGARSSVLSLRGTRFELKH